MKLPRKGTGEEQADSSCIAAINSTSGQQQDWYAIVPDGTPQGSRAVTGKTVKPPDAPDPKVRLTLKTGVAVVRCNYKRFA